MLEAHYLRKEICMIHLNLQILRHYHLSSVILLGDFLASEKLYLEPLLTKGVDHRDGSSNVGGT